MGGEKGGGRDGAFPRFGSDPEPDPSLGSELSHQALNSTSVFAPPSRDCADIQLHLRAAGSPSVNTLASLGPGGTELTQK